VDKVKDFLTENVGALGGPLIGAPVVEEMIGGVGKTLGKAADWVYEKVDEMTSDSGLGSKVDDLMKKSPTLAKNIQDVKKAGFSIRYGEPGKGTFMDPETKEIVVDPDSKGNTADIVQSLAHETGHALYTQDPEVPMDGLTKDEYVKRNTMRHLKDEGEATITNMKVREEIMKATGKDASGADAVDIGVAGAQSKKYLELYKKYPDPKDRDKLREEIGKVYAKGETPSGEDNKGLNYEDYYGKSYKDAWDEAHKK
jgi:type VI secretion system secreted protein VgrG